MFDSPGAYDRFMGRYSVPLAGEFIEFAATGRGDKVLDVGSGPGALTGTLISRLGAEVSAVDPSEPFVATLAAGLGVLARTRWAAVAAFAAGFGLALGLALGYTDILALVYRHDNGALRHSLGVGAIAAGACAAVVATIVSWRCARWMPRARTTMHA